MDEAYLRNAVRYVERNPIRSGLVARAEDYRWSSAAAHCGIRSDRLLADDLPILGIVEDWSSWLAVPNLREHDEMIRQRTESGYPCGPDEFVIQLEKKLGRPIRPQKSGRKPKQLECDLTALLKFSN
jgi:putative transposase